MRLACQLDRTLRRNGILAALLLAAFPAVAQSGNGAPVTPPSQDAAATQASAAQNGGGASGVTGGIAASVVREVIGEILREIDDPSTGARWVLLRNAAHPEGPGRLVLLASASQNSGAGQNAGLGRSPGAGQNSATGQGLGATGQLTDADVAAAKLVIRSGDKLIVEEHTPVVDAQLEAVALGPAARGGQFRVRLTIGGGIVVATAIDAGRAELPPASEARP